MKRRRLPTRAGPPPAFSQLQHLVEVVLADDVAQSRQRQLVDGGMRVGDIDDGLRRIDDAVPSTALTLIVTLSRVMVSCCSADTVKVRMSIVVARSMRSGMIQ